MRMDFLSIFLEVFRGPRKTIFCLKITCLKSAGNHGALQAKSTTFRVLFPFLKQTNYFFGTYNGKEKQKSMFRWPQNGRTR